MMDKKPSVPQYFEELKVQVIDDQEYMRVVLASILRGFGIRHVEVYPDPVTAFDELETFDASLILTDWDMKPVDGLQFIHRIRTGKDSPNPYVPIVHANFRYLEKGDVAWFGGGADLTPCYPREEDARNFHRTFKEACDAHDPEYYSRFKKWCDEYFTIRHRSEMRGVGGIFFDYLKDDLDGVFEFVQSVGAAILPAYLPIVQSRMEEPYGERQRHFQAIRRGRYTEFNLVYDRGTAFGLKTGGRSESILMSLPPVAEWVYDYTPEPDSPEALAATFFQPREWV